MSITTIISHLPMPFLHSWGYWFVLLAAILEAIPLLGLFVPGQSMVITGGFLAKLGTLEVGDVIWIAALGAIIGDLVGYFIGKFYGYSFLTKYGKYFAFKKENYEKVKNVMRGHTGKAMILGRFNPIMRAFAPFVAGASDISFFKFLIYNIIGGISWAVSFVLLGFIFGASYEVASGYIGRFIAFATILAILFIFLYYFINKKKHIFAKYHLYTLLLNIFSLYLFAKMIEDVIDSESITRLDAWISSHIVFLWNPLLNKLMIVINNIFTPMHLIILSALLFIFLLYKRKWYYSLLLFFTVGAASVTDIITEYLMQRIRPESFLITATGYSFPSGHVVLATIFFSILLYSFKDEIKGKIQKNLFISCNILMILLIGFDRIYLNVHWLSDVIAGLSISIFWLTLLILIFQLIFSIKNKLTVIN